MRALVLAAVLLTVSGCPMGRTECKRQCLPDAYAYRITDTGGGACTCYSVGSPTPADGPHR